MSTNPRIAVIGAGKVGLALGLRLMQSGFSVKIGIKKDGKPPSFPEGCGRTPETALASQAADWAEVVFLAVPGEVAIEAVASLGKLEGKVLVDCNNPLRWEQGPVWAPPKEGSLAAAIAAAVPGAKVVKAFNTFGAEFHANPLLGARGVDVLMAGDDTAAKDLVARIASASGFTPLDAGPLRNAALLENLAMLWIHLALLGGQSRGFAFQLQRRP